MKRVILFITFICFLQTAGVFAATKTQRIISLTPATTEIAYRLGLKREIIGVTTFCNYPPEAVYKEKIGTFSHPDTEKIVSLKPDIILATGLEQAPVVERLRQLGLKVYLCYPASIAELFDAVRDIGKLTDRNEEAEVLVGDMEKVFGEIKDKVSNIPQMKRKKVFIEIWHDPLMTVGKKSFVNELIVAAGGINIAADVMRPYCYFSAEEVIVRNPDYIFFGHKQKSAALEVVQRRLGWSKIHAVEKEQVYDDINPDLFLRPGPRLVEGLREIHKRLYKK